MSKTIFRLEGDYYIWDNDRCIPIYKEIDIKQVLLRDTGAGFGQAYTEHVKRILEDKGIYSEVYSSVEDVLRDYINYPLTVKEFLEL